MALVSTSLYNFPEPGVDGYTSMRTPIVKLRENAKGVRIGEFVKYRYSVALFYPQLLKADYEAIISAAQGASASVMSGVSITFWDKDGGTYLTKTMQLEPPQGKLLRMSPWSYKDVTIELTEL